MKKLLLGLCAVFICTIAIAHTINWNDGDSTIQTTCNAGDNVTPPTPIGKYGYHFKEWEQYMPVEYLESTGTQWIDTGVIPTSNMRIKYTFARVDFADNNTSVLWGSRTSGTYQTSTNQFYAGCTVRAQCWYYSATQMSNLGSFSLYTIYTYEVSNNSTVTEAAQPIYLFALNYNGTEYVTPYWRLYSFKIYNAYDTLIRDFIPVLDKDKVPCMYDKVTQQFYYNQGTGEFIAGPKI